MRTPAAAVLWESWRLSRLRLAVAVFVAVFGGAALIVSPMDGAWSARLALMQAAYWALISQAWAGNVESRKGFSMRLGFVRPIPTWMLVSVPMAYVGITCAMTYLVSVLILRAAFGISFPLLPLAASVGTLSLVMVSSNWWTQNAGVRAVRFGLVAMFMLLWLYFGRPTAGNALSPDRWPELFAFSAQAYAWMALISLTAIGVTIVGVDRQRRGDDEFTLAKPTGRSADAPARTPFRAWIADRLRVPCPTSSPTRAQLWFELYTVGGRVLAIGVLIALAAPVSVTILEAAGFGGEYVVVWAGYAFLAPLIVGFRTLLGVRRKQGISYLSAFIATRPMGTGRLIGLKVLVTSAAVIGTWVAIGTSLWLFGERLAVWGPKARSVLADYQSDFVPSLPPTTESLSIAANILVFVTAGVACAGTFHALLLLNKKRVVLAGLGLALYTTLLVVVGVRGWVDAGAIATSHLWFVTGAVFLGAIALFRHTLAERIFTPRGFTGLLVLWTAFALAYGWGNPIGIGAAGQPPELDDIVTLVLTALLMLPVLALSPWSFGRIRHR